MNATAFDPKERFAVYAQLMRIDKPIGTLLLLWPTWWGLWMAADGWPGWPLFFIFTAGTFLMRSAGCVINDYADRNFDGAVERTKHRPFARGVVTKKEALTLAASLTLASLLLILPLNALTLWLSLPAAFLAGSYPFTKRFFPIPQAYLGIAFAFGIPMAFAAVQNTVPGVAWLMLAASAFWTVAYDTCYAMVDKPDDLKIGIKTSAITFGDYDVAAVMACQAAFLALMGVVGQLAALSWPYYAGLAVAAGLVLSQYPGIASRDRARCFKVFLDNNRAGFAIFAGLALSYLLA
ncbi:4-hydroxybenzoate octaprenyltransferase [Crenobacter cavernae]|uniref:4-hydroxybenzoate octaprenyltransferase n=1 Tax=Crenobacter cavernae TaxID=2290923 RepID=A0A345Y304_9NEIS|nr:4-hydroxybenzoate octaprenyltransferase [Crenobacter cavernae]AXK38306.1 4-hydroxybenzoate octaprenyltransferase [Crenobacter cavernae]